MSMALDLDLLRTFTAVIEAASFTRAAARIHLTQPTVSLQIKKLEAAIGHQLLLRDRATGGVRTTEQGELLLGYARRLLSISAEAQDALRRPTAPRTVRLGVPEDFAGWRLIGLLSGFARESPQIRLDTVSGWSMDLRRLLESGDVDLALIKREPADGPCLSSWEETLAWVAGGPDGSLNGDPVPLCVFPPGCIYRDRAIRGIEALGRRWRIAYASQGLMGVQAAVAGGLGISVLPLSAMLPEHKFIDSLEVAAPPPSELALVSSLHRPGQAARAVADFLIDHLNRLNTGLAGSTGDDQSVTY